MNGPPTMDLQQQVSLMKLLTIPSSLWNLSLSGTHTNTQEGLWYHVKRTIVGTRNLEMSLIDFMFRRKFHATGGNVQLVNCFNGYISVLKCE